jgi:hypothetical protein
MANWLKRLFGGGEETAAADDPWGGKQSEEYRQADPRDIVVETDGTVMSGPGGAPQEDLSVEERRDLDRNTD